MTRAEVAIPSQPTLGQFFGSSSQASRKKRIVESDSSDHDAKQTKMEESGSESDVTSEDEHDIESEEVAKKLTSVPASKATWAKGQPVPYAYLVQGFVKIEATTKRLEITSLATQLLLTIRESSPDNLLHAVYLTFNHLAPEYEGIELGIGESILLRAIAESTGRSLAQIKADYTKTGDLGLVAVKSKSNQPTMFKPTPLTITKVFKTLKEIASTSGKDSVARKTALIKGLIAACVDAEAKFLIRSLEGKLRIGLADKTVISALAAAVVTHDVRKKHHREPKAAELSDGESILKDVFNEIPSLDLIVPALVQHGIEDLKQHCKLTPGVPLKPMLAHPTKAVAEVLDRFEDTPFTSEYKYDGERAQIHCETTGRISVYSRNSEDMSKRYPDILSGIGAARKEGTESFILDCEAVAWDRNEQRILPFQVLSTRKRKDVKQEDITVRVCVFAFDLLYLNGESLLQTSFEDRRSLLYKHFQEVKGEFTFAKYENAQSVEDIQIFLELSVQDSCEGLMVKTLRGPESFYEPSRRSRKWLKIKKDYLSGAGDSLDLVVLGAFHGRGKRANVYGAFLLGCYNPDRQEYETICKIGTGFSEAALESHYQALSPFAIERPRSDYVHSPLGQQPDVWFSPRVVWEVLAAEASVSPKYKASMTVLGGDKGISLRFPRFLRQRDDKKVTDATTSAQVSEFYRKQNRGQKKAVDDDFEY